MKKILKSIYGRCLDIKERMNIFFFGHKKYNKFVIISRSRTGSTLLMTLLNNHKNIICEGELFQRLNGKSCKQIWNSSFSKQPKNIRQVGFKLFYYHPFDDDKSVWDFILKDKNITIIHLIRKNKLKSLVSREIAELTNKWAEYSYNKDAIKIEDKMISLNYYSCLKSFEKIEFYENKTRNQFSEHNFLEIDYENLVEQEEKVIRDIFKLLKVEYQKVTASNKKQNPEGLKKLIINYEDLKTQFKNTKWHPFFED